MNRGLKSLSCLAAAVVVVGASARADVRIAVEDFESGGFNFRFTHDIQDQQGATAAWEIRDHIDLGLGNVVQLPSEFLHLHPARDDVTWDVSDLGDQILAASVDVFDHEGGFAGTSTASVIFHGFFADKTMRPPDTSGVYTLSVTFDTIGDTDPANPDRMQAIGPIQSISLVGAVDADFDNVAVTVNHKHCPCDFNQDNTYDVFDLLAFLSAWFPQDEVSDFNGDGEFDVFDLLDFLNCWFDPANSGLRFCP